MTQSYKHLQHGRIHTLGCRNVSFQSWSKDELMNGDWRKNMAVLGFPHPSTLAWDGMGKQGLGADVKVL